MLYKKINNNIILVKKVKDMGGNKLTNIALKKLDYEIKQN